MTTLAKDEIKETPARRARLARSFQSSDSRAITLVLVFALLTIYFHFASHGIFFSPRNISLLLRQASIVAVVAAGVSILIIMGEIDLSIGSAVYLCSVVAASLQTYYGVGTLETVLATIVVGVALGAWQGAWVVGVSIPSFVVTLSGLLAFRGFGYWLSNAQTIAPVTKAFSALSEGFIGKTASYATLAVILALGAAGVIAGYRRAAQEGRENATRTGLALIALIAAVGVLAWAFGGFLGIPEALVWVAAIGALLTGLMTRTKFGRNAYLVGANREAAVLAGISLGRQLIFGFVLMGFLYGVAGVLITARLGAATASSGLFLELDAIAGAVIGGTSLRGGIGSVPGAIAGAVLLTTIDNGMSILNVSSFLQMVVKGLVLLFALAFDAVMSKRRSIGG
jgi:D-xylose transport system permease protein